jgi:hypothetical protein
MQQNAMNGWGQQANSYQSVLNQTACAPTPASPIPGAVQTLGDSINDLDSVLEMLHARLASVMHPAGPRPAPDNGKVQCSMSPLVEEVSGWRNRVQMLTERVRDMLERLET